MIAKTPHIDGELVVSVQPNCSQTGEITTTCTYCQLVYVVEILPVNDDHDLQETVVKEPTCTEKGEGTKTCTRCDYAESVSYEIKEHNYKKTDIWGAATCINRGFEDWECTDCGHIHRIYSGYGDHSGGMRCSHCGSILQDINLGGNNTTSTSYGKNSSNTPEWPVIIWDVSESMRPKP